VQVWSQ
jgi:hypothetical protein